jgi:hypothetical protein
MRVFTVTILLLIYSSVGLSQTVTNPYIHNDYDGQNHSRNFNSTFFEGTGNPLIYDINTAKRQLYALNKNGFVIGSEFLSQAKTDTFRNEIQESVLDSIVLLYHDNVLYRSGKYSFGTINIINDSVRARYNSFFAKVYGQILEYTPFEGTVTRYGDSILLIAQMQSEVSCTNAKGRLSVSLRIIRADSLQFLSMDFTPFDYIEVPAFSKVASITLDSLKARNVKAVIKTSTLEFRHSIVNRKRFESALNELNYDSIVQFTSGMALIDERMFIRTIYDMPTETKYLMLCYADEGKGFKLCNIGFIDKKQN